MVVTVLVLGLAVDFVITVPRPGVVVIPVLHAGVILEPLSEPYAEALPAQSAPGFVLVVGLALSARSATSVLAILHHILSDACWSGRGAHLVGGVGRGFQCVTGSSSLSGSPIP